MRCYLGLLSRGVGYGRMEVKRDGSKKVVGQKSRKHTCCSLYTLAHTLSLHSRWLLDRVGPLRAHSQSSRRPPITRRAQHVLDARHRIPLIAERLQIELRLCSFMMASGAREEAHTATQLQIVVTPRAFFKRFLRLSRTAACAGCLPACHRGRRWRRVAARQVPAPDDSRRA